MCKVAVANLAGKRRRTRFDFILFFIRLIFTSAVRGSLSRLHSQYLALPRPHAQVGRVMEARGNSARPRGEGPSGRLPKRSAAAPAADASPRETVLGNCARCGSGDKLKFCSRCQVVRYCGRECQAADVSGRGRGGVGVVEVTIRR